MVSAPSRRTAASLACLAGAVGLALVGCYPKAEGERLAREADERDARITALESGSQEARDQVARAVAEAQTKVDELRALLEQATDVVTRNSADVGTEVEALREQLQTLDGQLAEVRNSLESTQRQ